MKKNRMAGIKAMTEYCLLIFYNNASRIEFYPISKCRIIISQYKEDDIYVSIPALKNERIVIFQDDIKWVLECKGYVLEENINDLQRVRVDDGKVNICGNAAVWVIKNYTIPIAKISLIDNEIITVGRASDNDIKLIPQRVSGHHLQFERENKEFYVVDRNSTNGSWIGNDRLIGKRKLNEDDRIQIEQFHFILNKGYIYLYGDEKEVNINENKIITNEFIEPKDFNKKEKKRMPVINRPIFTRSPRLINELPSGEVEIEAAPALPQKPELNWFSILLPPIGMFALMVLMSIVMNRSSASSSYNPMTMYLFSGSMMIISMIVSVTNYSKQIKKYNQFRVRRKSEYEKYLGEKRKELVEIGNEQRDILERIYPSAKECQEIIEGRKRRLWERMYNDRDFMRLRIGTGETDLGVSIKIPKVGFVIDEDEYLRIPEEISEVSQKVKNTPIYCDMKEFPRCGVSGNYNEVASLVRCMIIQAITNHGYDEVKIIGLFETEHEKQWKWLRFLPHNFSKDRSMRYLAFGSFDVELLLKTMEDTLKQRIGNMRDSENEKKQVELPYYLFVIDGLSILGNHPIMTILSECDSSLNCGYIVMAENISGLPRSANQIIRLGADKKTLYIKSQRSYRFEFVPEKISIENADICARKLAPVRLLISDGKEGKLPDKVGFMEGFDARTLDDLNIGENWKNSDPSKSMEVPIGKDIRGETFVFDINEKKHGPHGLVAGMTGYGKSELVQTWILSMSILFSPSDVSFVLIDFKGTGLILPFKNLPHLAGTISDIDTDIGRNLVALRAELQRRKELFDKTGTSNIKGYIELYRAGKVDEPLSYLFVIIDEYAEFKSNYPDFTSEVNSLFRTGRALGVHIIIMTQNPSGVISAESESNVHFRWCLKVANASASKEILGGHAEAAQIMQPGRAYIRVGEDEIFEPIQSFYSGTEYLESGKKKHVSVKIVSASGKRTEISNVNNTTKNNKKEIDKIVDYISTYASNNNVQSARKIWNEPLPAVIKMDLSIPDMHPGILAPIVGMIDDPATQSQYPFIVPISQDGHVLIIGAPGSGKTTFLQTLTMSLCNKYSAEEVNIYMLDFGSWGMGAFSEFPQIGAIANSNEDQKIEKIMDLLEECLDERKKKFASSHVGSIQAYNRIGKEHLPYIVFIIDNFAPVLQVFPHKEDLFKRLTQEGGSYGVYLVATSSSTSGIRYSLLQSIKTKIALQMTDSSEYSNIVGKTGGIIPKTNPGRGLFRADRVMEFQIALPVDNESEEKRGDLVREEGRKQRVSWKGTKIKSVKMLPEIIPYGSIAPSDGYAIGLSLKDVSPVIISKDNPHLLLVSGKSGSGNTNIIRVLARQMKARQGSHILIYGNANEYMGIGGENVLITNKGEIFDKCLKQITDELQKRKDTKTESNKTLPLFVLIDGMSKCIDDMSQESAARLNAIAQIGKGLNVMLVAAEEVSALNSLKGYWPVINRMAETQVLIVGGRVSEHIIVDTGLSASEKSVVMNMHDGLLWKKEKVVSLRIMNSN